MRRALVPFLLSLLLIPAACAEDDGGYCGAARDWNGDWEAYENEVLELVNQHRAAGANCGGEDKPPVGALTMDPALQCAARVHSLDMVDRGYFAHDTPEGVTPWDRIESAGYDASARGENIAAGYPTPAAVVDGWMNSPGHCNNIMSGGSNEIGVGFVGDGTMWTQVFGNR